MSLLLDLLAADLAVATTWQYSTTVVLNPARVQIHLGGDPESPDAVVVLTTYPGGPEPDSRNGWTYPRLQVKVRGTDPLAALALDLDAFNALQFTPGGPQPRDIGGLFLQDCYALQSEAEPLGQDSQGRWSYVRNYQLSVEGS